MDETVTLFEAGRAAWMRNDLPQAETDLRAALVSAPGNPAIRAALGAVLLKTGRLNEGFRLFDAWREIRAAQGKGTPELPLARWRGQPARGRRILVLHEDGFGDQIMYARFARALAEQGADVVWHSAPELERLFTESLGVRILPPEESIDLKGDDFYCPSSALPLGFDLTWETLPSAPYLDAPSVDRGARIGVMTEFNRNNTAGLDRALSPELSSWLESLPGALSLIPAVSGAADFADTASLIAGLDLVITVDTAVAHLAGAMGRPVWILLPYVAEWRWGGEGERTPWYPTARLFRQGPDADWSPVLAQLSRELGVS